jgi:hypothetical protein
VLKWAISRFAYIAIRGCGYIPTSLGGDSGNAPNVGGNKWRRKVYKMVDVCGGKLTLREVTDEILNYMRKSPKRLIVDIRREKDGYRSTLWISRGDFKRKC